MKAKYSSKFETVLMIKLKNDVKLELGALGCTEFVLKNIENYKFEGNITVEIDTPDMQSANQLISKIVGRVFQVLNIKHRVSNEFLEIHQPVLINAEDWENVEKSAYSDISVKASIDKALEEMDFSEISDIIQNIESYPSKPYIHRILKVFDGYRNSSHDEKLIEGWRVIDLFIGQSRLKGDEGKGTITLVNEFINDHITTQDSKSIIQKYKKFIDDLSNANIITRDGKKNRSTGLKQSITSNNQKDIIRQSLHCIYEIRNLKLHKEESHQTYQTSLFLLEGFLRDFWEIRLRDNYMQK